MEELIPLTRIEKYLAKIAGEDITAPEARTRLETYLAKIAEEEVEVPEPRTRLEYYLNKIAENGEGGGGGNPNFGSIRIAAIVPVVVLNEPNVDTETGSIILKQKLISDAQSDINIIKGNGSGYVLCISLNEHDMYNYNIVSVTGASGSEGYALLPATGFKTRAFVSVVDGDTVRVVIQET